MLKLCIKSGNQAAESISQFSQQCMFPGSITAPCQDGTCSSSSTFFPFVTLLSMSMRAGWEWRRDVLKLCSWPGQQETSHASLQDTYLIDELDFFAFWAWFSECHWKVSLSFVFQPDSSVAVSLIRPLSDSRGVRQRNGSVTHLYKGPLFSTETNTNKW